MFNRKKVKNKFNVKKITVSLPASVLESIFDECDVHSINETGGRIVGVLNPNSTSLQIEVHDIIDAGPKARKSPTSLFQDGEYQESVFRRIESRNPSIEHLGSWHTHHVNGLKSLSAGDIATYMRTVNHDNHNIDFFYALLVTEKNSKKGSSDRYTTKHFLLLRGDTHVYKVPQSQIKITGEIPSHIHTAPKSHTIESRMPGEQNLVANEVRSTDKNVLSEMYPDLKPFLSKKTGNIYWKGKLDLVNDTSVEVCIMESFKNKRPVFSIQLLGSPRKNFKISNVFDNRTFESARKAIWLFERDLNRELFNKNNRELFNKNKGGL